MIIGFKRCKVYFHCDDCAKKIERNEPFYFIEFDQTESTISICEDCGNRLKNEMADEYSKFVNMNL